MSEIQPGSVDPEDPDVSLSPVPVAIPSPSPAGMPESWTPGELVRPPRLWGPWATIGWTLVCIAVLFFGQFVGALIYVFARALVTGVVSVDGLATNGNLLAAATLFSTPLTIGLVALLIWIRRYPLRDYLALRWPQGRSIVIALFGLALVLVGTDLTSYLTGRPLVPSVMVEAYQTSWLPGLMFAMVVLAPLGEETLFRGFLYAGIAASRAGPIVAVIVSTVIFSSLHVQYDWYGVAGVAAIGLYLGVVRYQTRSLFLTMLLHAIGNGVATLEIVVQELWLK